MKKKSIYLKAHIIFGFFGFALGSYALFKTLQFKNTQDNFSGLILFFSVTGICFLASMINFYIAYGFKYGMIDQVAGSYDLATVTRSNKKVFESSLWFVRHLNDSDSSEKEKYVFFISRYLPWICLDSNFLAKKKESNLTGGKT